MEANPIPLRKFKCFEQEKEKTLSSGEDTPGGLVEESISKPIR